MLAESHSQPSVASPKASSGSDSEFTRLHISPLDPELAKIIITAAVADKARNISYHNLETFPERRFGYIELPTMDAEKLKKKFSGTTLKGNKIRVEKARPEERLEPTAELDKTVETEEQKSKSKRESETLEARKKRKRDPDVVEGVVLNDRKVKRGWTEPADQRRKKSRKDKETDKEGKTTEKKKRPKSMYTEGDECLLKTKVPAHAVANISVDNLPRKHRKKSKARDIIVHEFEKTTKFPSFLKNSVSELDSKHATKFVQGQGWMDEDGNVLESVKARKSPEPKAKKVKKKATPPPIQEDDDSTSSSGTSSSGSSSDEESEEESEEEEQSVTSEKERVVPNHDKSPEQPGHSTPTSAIKADSSRPMSSGSSRSLTIKIPPPGTPSTTTVHPLEALYKRSKPDATVTETPAQDAQPFSFFGANDDEDDDDIDAEPADTPAPMTPFSRQDFEWRNSRSAAPTPDTAHPSRMKNFWAQEEEEEEEDADMADALQEAYQEDNEDGQAPAQGQTASTDFQAWFWENRRDLNRSWMKRRKTAAKEKRHRDNKARASKAV